MQELTAAFRSLSSTVSGYIHIHPVINEACEDSSKPTPGYLYKEISEMTFESTETCMKILDLLCEKMESGSAIVKYKALNVVKNVLQKGSPAFFREMGRKHHVIRECLNFRGPADPLHGDAPYVQVRDLAQQVINMIYDTQPAYTDTGSVGNPYALSSANQARGSFEPITQSPPPMAYRTGSNVTYGAPSTQYQVSTTVTGTTQDGGRRVFVNTPKAIGSYVEYTPSRLETMMDAMSEGLDSFKASLVGKEKNASQPRPYVYGSGASTATAPNLTYASSFTTADVSSLDHAGNNDISQWAPSGPSNASAHEIAGLTRSVTAIMEGWEYQWVSQLTPANGRPFPARNDVSDFVAKATQLAGAQALQPLLEALLVRILLPDLPWQTKLKALFLLESIFRAELENVLLLTQPFLVALLQLSQDSVQTALQDKVTAIINMYPPNQRPANFQKAPQRPDPTQQPTHNSNTADSQESLFSGLSDRTIESRTTPNLIDDDFSFLTPSQPVSSSSIPEKSHSHTISSPANSHSTQAASTGSLFDGLELDSSSTRAAAPTAPQASSNDLLLDFGSPSQAMPYQQPRTTGELSLQNGLSSSLQSVPSTSQLEKDFFSAPVQVPQSNPTATLGQLQPNSSVMTSQHLQTEGRGSMDQLAILNGRKAALVDYLNLVQMQTASDTKATKVNELTAQLRDLEAQIRAIEASSLSGLNGNSAGMSLEALYKQQPTNTTNSSVDFHALQTSHPVDPFDALRHDIRR